MSVDRGINQLWAAFRLRRHRLESFRVVNVYRHKSKHSPSSKKLHGSTATGPSSSTDDESSVQGHPSDSDQHDPSPSSALSPVAAGSVLRCGRSSWSAEQGQ